MLYLPKPRSGHLVCGSGGPKASLMVAGWIAALKAAGQARNYLTIGGVSGGAIPAVLFASGMSESDIVKHCLDCNFGSLLPRHQSIKQVLRELVRAEYRKDVLHHGLRDSTPLGEAIERLVPVWPENFWTMAICGDTEILFTATGVYELSADGSCHIIHDGPAPLGLAIRATCTIPLMISPVQFKGRLLQDGALSKFGKCPTGVPKHYFGAEDKDIIACVPAETAPRKDGFLYRLGKHLAGNHQALVRTAAIVIEPRVASFNGLQFNLGRGLKEEAVLAGFIATVHGLHVAGLLDGAARDRLIELSQTFASFAAACGLAVPPIE